MPAKFDRCVRAVGKRRGYNPYAVCHASLNRGLTKKQKAALIRDEREGMKEYKALYKETGLKGFRKAASDEKRHLKYLRGLK